jgi:hypothetical protein
MAYALLAIGFPLLVTEITQAGGNSRRKVGVETFPNGAGRGSSPLLDSFTVVQLARASLPKAVQAVNQWTKSCAFGSRRLALFSRP